LFGNVFHYLKLNPGCTGFFLFFCLLEKKRVWELASVNVKCQ